MSHRTSRLLALAFAASSTLGACDSDAPPAEDSGIVFMLPDSGIREDAGPPPGSVGTMCNDDPDCSSGSPACLVTDGFEGGYCTDYCFPEDPSTCSAGSLCTPIRFMVNACLQACDPMIENPCRQGYGCGEIGPEGPVCAPGCDVDSDCAAGLRCSPMDGQLAEGECFSPDAELGDPCVEVEQCGEDSWCVNERDRGWPGGGCTVFDCNEIDDTGCEGDAHCVFDFYRDPICVDGCAIDSDCRTGYACRPDDTYPDRMRCTPACTDDSVCTDDATTCDRSTGRCG